MEASLESELKYRAAAEAPLDALAHQTWLGPATLGPVRAVDEEDRYLDTVDRRLSVAGWACRLRTRGDRTIISLKGPGQHAAGAAIHRRLELEGPAAHDLDPLSWPPSPARERLLELSGSTPLFERLTLAQHRTEREVQLDGQRVGLLSLDRARVLHQGRELGVLLVVELELDPAALATGLDPGALERALGDVDGLLPDPASKLERALALIGEAPA
ncbi:MAG TPA: CYTH domain-containing protein [Candidatus Dormibacteraeota bacterium]|nr:CYTH domain-containing protein [Candidatus Dormibacteraeota bacterium]